MTFFNVVIGYWIIAAVMTTDIDLSKEVIGWRFMVWTLCASTIPLVIIWKADLRNTLIEQLKTPGKRIKPLSILLAVIALVWGTMEYMGTEQKRMEKRTNVDLPSYGSVIAHSYLPSN